MPIASQWRQVALSAVWSGVGAKPAYYLRIDGGPIGGTIDVEVMSPTLTATNPPPPLPQQACGLVQDCTFSTWRTGTVSLYWGMRCGCEAVQTYGDTVAASQTLGICSDGCGLTQAITYTPPLTAGTSLTLSAWVRALPGAPPLPSGTTATLCWGYPCSSSGAQSPPLPITPEWQQATLSATWSGAGAKPAYYLEIDGGPVAPAPNVEVMSPTLFDPFTTISVSPTVPPASGIIPWHAAYQQSLSTDLQARVDLSDGHLDLSASAMRIPGLGPDLALDHTWDSVLAQNGVTTTAGNGWLDSFTPSMGGTLTGTVVYSDSTGATWPFTYTGAPSDPGPYSAYTGVPGQPWQLTTSTAGYTLTDVLNGAVRTFDTQGRLLTDRDAYHAGNTASYTGAAALPDSVTNGGGHALQIVAQNGLLSEVQSPLRASGGPGQGQDVTYSYTSTDSLLAAITQGAGTADVQTTHFGYSPDGTHLTSIVTPGGHAWSIQYDPYGRVSQITSPVSGTLSQAGYTPSYTTQFYYPAGQAQVVEGADAAQPRTTTYGLSAQGEPITITNALGYASTLRYDADHDVTSATDANNHTTAYDYQYVGPAGPSGLGSTGLLTEAARPAIDGSGPVTTLYSYDANNNLVKAVSGNGGLTYYQYDAHHSVITTTQLLTGTVWRGTVNVISPTTGLLLAQVDGRGVSVPAPGPGPDTHGHAHRKLRPL